MVRPKWCLCKLALSAQYTSAFYLEINFLDFCFSILFSIILWILIKSTPKMTLKKSPPNPAQEVYTDSNGFSPQYLFTLQCLYTPLMAQLLQTYNPRLSNNLMMLEVWPGSVPVSLWALYVSYYLRELECVYILWSGQSANSSSEEPVFTPSLTSSLFSSWASWFLRLLLRCVAPHLTWMLSLSVESLQALVELVFSWGKFICSSGRKCSYICQYPKLSFHTHD